MSIINPAELHLLSQCHDNSSRKQSFPRNHLHDHWLLQKTQRSRVNLCGSTSFFNLHISPLPSTVF